MLRTMDRDDLEWVRRERNRPENMQWFRQPLQLTENEQNNWFNNTDMKSYVVLDAVGNKVGVVSLSKIDLIARKCEFSIMILPEVRGRGYGKKALIDLLTIAFDSLNMFQVYSDVFEKNPALNMYKEMGFIRVANLPNWYFKDGKYISSEVITIQKDGYNRLKQTVSKS